MNRAVAPLVDKRLNIDAVDLAIQASPDQLLAINDALDRLAREDSAAARLVELRYFAGLTVEAFPARLPTRPAQPRHRLLGHFPQG